jgi:threonine synthase
MAEIKIACAKCGLSYPDAGALYKCPTCAGLFDYIEAFNFQPSTYNQISLGEGNTPLIPAKVFGRAVYFKCEYLNPTGSFKDRGTATLISFLASRGVKEAIEDSSGNAGASFAAYAARAGIKARVYIPDSASGPKRKQIEAYGAELIPIAGPRRNASKAAMQAADEGTVYASHAYLPFNLQGYAACAHEIREQLGREPGAVILPAGQGGFLLGMARGFEALLSANKIQKMPMMIGVQARACAPLYSLWKNGTMEIQESSTIAEGVRNRESVRAEAVVEITRRSGGRFTSVDEADILAGRDALARLGFYVEPTSALVWRALEESIPLLPDPIVVVLTGSGLKYFS